MLTINDDHLVMRRFHKPGVEKRSVVIVQPGDCDDWLSCRSTGEARSMLRPCAPEQLVEEAASRRK